ncbi:bone morphogenetic protein receptor type-2 isoform X3 [Austrofundulus limnaeus]|uniref:Bone morphogenetic protein receptor type-2 isoform X3 n=1 Tax=Austrofundulus limnaeus TaxID=52670 RepID=A0A2I4CVE5_AUSLI|nr:PREDICTED: bone morphogenetic protein receptor type-2-like isoform X3 [Austrofundulus limnaeus]
MRRGTGMRQVETGVAKMNTLTVGPPAEPHLVTTVTKMRSSAAAGTDVHSVCRTHRPTLETSRTTGGGRTNPAGPQEEEEEEEEAGLRGGGGGADLHLNLLLFSSDEEEPLLSREQLPAQTEPPVPQNRAGGPGSNSNNNNNRPSGPEPPPGIRGPPGPLSDPEPRIWFCGPAALQTPHTTCDGGFGTGPEPGPHSACPEPPGLQISQEQNPAPEPLTSSLDQKPEPHPGAPEPPFVDPAAPGSPTVKPAEPQIPGPLQVQLRQSRTRRPERPSSLDLSSSCFSSGGSSVPDPGSLSSTGDKIRRRVKTPYTLKKWRPASWVLSADLALDLDLEISSTSSGQIQFSSSPHRARGLSLNQSRSSMAVFLVGGGATATTTSDPDKMTRF